jgi:predicted HTH transcriptional regulator
MMSKPEKQNIEFKSSWHDDYLKWICGFANAQGKITNKEYQKLFTVSRETASRDLADMTHKGVFISSGRKGAGS